MKLLGSKKPSNWFWKMNWRYLGNLEKRFRKWCCAPYCNSGRSHVEPKQHFWSTLLEMEIWFAFLCRCYIHDFMPPLLFFKLTDFGGDAHCGKNFWFAIKFSRSSSSSWVQLHGQEIVQEATLKATLLLFLKIDAESNSLIRRSLLYIHCFYIAGSAEVRTLAEYENRDQSLQKSDRRGIMPSQRFLLLKFYFLSDFELLPTVC